MRLCTPPVHKLVFSLLKGIALILLLSVISITDGFGTQYTERKSSLPAEKVEKVKCPAKNCLVIEENSTYCSIDPYKIDNNAAFSTKSELQLSPAILTLSESGSLPNLSIRITTKAGERTLWPGTRNIYALHHDDYDPEIGIAPLEWIEIDSPYGASDFHIEKFFLRTSRWPHDHFYLGDPHDIGWFFQAARNLFIQLSSDTVLFPGLFKETIFFAPCSMRGLPDQFFDFRFMDGSVLTLRVRVISGSNEIGYYVGRLMEAEGEFASVPLHIQNRNDLSFYGSTRSIAEMTIPTFAIRTSTEGRSCGFILDSSQSESDLAINGYIAYEMTCNERRGRRLTLQAVSYPDVFVLP